MARRRQDIFSAQEEPGETGQRLGRFKSADRATPYQSRQRHLHLQRPTVPPLRLPFAPPVIHVGKKYYTTFLSF